jgi:hypothetical protein
MFWPFRRSTKYISKLDKPLMWYSKHDAFTLRDSLEGALILGATGSGKSSGSGKALALAYLEAGFGGLVLTAKSDERKIWENYCRLAGRRRDLYVFSPANPLRFNFLDYELQRKGKGAGLTDNILHLLSEVLQIAERQSGQGGREDEGYWRRSNRQLIRNVIDLLIIATSKLSVPEMYQVVISAPKSVDQARSADWQDRSFCYRCLNDATTAHKTQLQQHDLEIVTDYFMEEFPALSERTRSVVVSTFTSMIDVLNRGILSELFCGQTNFTPEAIENGAILVIDLPVKEYAEVGVFAQVLWKSAFQRSIERRNLQQNDRPVFLWADEAQYVTTDYDMQFQTTCRASRVATVYLTQNISNFYATLGGGEQGRSAANSLFGNLNTKIFHANGDPVTNEWASTLIGRSRQFLTNATSSYDPDDGFSNCWDWSSTPRTSAGVSEHIDFEVPPREFTILRRGGRANRRRVDAIAFQGGRRFRSNGRTWLPVIFEQ